MQNESRLNEIKTAQTPSISDLQAKIGLQEAFIYSLKNCVSNKDAENLDLKAHNSRLKIDLAESQSRLFRFRDYDDVRQKSILGYEAGFERGQIEVSNYVSLTS